MDQNLSVLNRHQTSPTVKMNPALNPEFRLHYFNELHAVHLHRGANQFHSTQKTFSQLLSWDLRLRPLTAEKRTDQ